MTKVSGKGPIIQSQTTPAAAQEVATKVKAELQSKSAAITDEVGDIPGAGKVHSSPELPTEAVTTSLESLAASITTPTGEVSGRADVNVSTSGNAQHTQTAAALCSAGAALTTHAELAGQIQTAGQGVQASLVKSQQSSYSGTFNSGNYEDLPNLPQGFAFCNAVTGHGSSMTLGTKAQNMMDQIGSQCLPQDPMAFVQFVLRESYLETTNCLMDHANKVRFFNDVKKELRAKMQDVRDVLAANAGKEDTDVIGDLGTSSPNMTYYGQTQNAGATGSSTTGTTGTTGTSGATGATGAANTAATTPAAIPPTAVSLSAKEIKKNHNYQGAENDTGITTEFNEATSSTADYVNGLTAAEWAAMEGQSVTVEVKAEDRDGDCADGDCSTGSDHLSNSDTITITPGMTKAQFIAKVNNSDALVQTKKDFSTADGSSCGTLCETSTTITFPARDVMVSADKIQSASVSMGTASAGSASSDDGVGTWSMGENATTKAQFEAALENYETQLNTVGDDGQLANVDLQNWLQKQQQTMQMMSNISKLLHDTAMAVIRKIG